MSNVERWWDLSSWNHFYLEMKNDYLEMKKIF